MADNKQEARGQNQPSTQSHQMKAGGSSQNPGSQNPSTQNNPQKSGGSMPPGRQDASKGGQSASSGSSHK